MLPNRIADLVTLLRLRVEENPHQSAYNFLVGGETETISWTYQELDHKARTIASALQEKFLVGERALLLYQPSLDFIGAFFGCLYAGMIPIPAYPPRPNQSFNRLQAIINDSQAAIALTSSKIYHDIERRFQETQQSGNCLLLNSDLFTDDLANNWQQPQIQGHALAFLQYTSGSTGKPKGVMVSHHNLICNLEDLDRGWIHTPESRLVTWLPTFHDMGLIYGTLQPLYRAFPCYMMAPVYFLQRPLRWLQAISRYRGTHSGAPNFAYDLCVRKVTPEELAELDLSCWKMALNGAEPVKPEVLHRFTQTFQSCGFQLSTFCPGYGLAEATLKVSAVKTGNEPLFYKLQAEALEKNQIIPAENLTDKYVTLVGCGTTEIDTQIMIVNPETKTVCPSDQVGEIWVKGETIAQGYWEKSEETKATFDAYLADTGAGPFLRTGDLGFIYKQELFVTGRLKEVVIIKGRNYYPQDIEKAIQNSHPALRVDAGAAFSIEVEHEERLVIVQEVERTYLRKLNVDEVMTCINKAVGINFEIQFHAVVLIKTNSLPKTSSGKIQRLGCRKKFLEGSLNVIAKQEKNKIFTINSTQ
ncbi:MAG: fatty acyl-AMP ligase [Sphaerospermopsis sp. SIO1G2]|nr:fatty acyl-AMP ligase [Sphaerospermopsis sp. SIO1G2]